MTTGVVFKYELPIDGGELELPQGAKVLTVAPPASHGDGLRLWALHDRALENAKETRTFVVLGTGHVVEDPDSLTYVGTIFLGWLVFHVFEDVG